MGDEKLVSLLYPNKTPAKSQEISKKLNDGYRSLSQSVPVKRKTRTPEAETAKVILPIINF